METKAHILVLQWDADARGTMADILASEGYRVTVVGGEPAAVARLKDQKFDLVLTGLRMRDVRGADVVRRVRGFWPQTPVVIVTSNPDERVKQSALEAGALELVGKPFRIENFLGAVRGALAGI